MSKVQAKLPRTTETSNEKLKGTGETPYPKMKRFQFLGNAKEETAGIL
jgi:hypothetical protein